jgi:hypothetical protein
MTHKAPTSIRLAGWFWVLNGVIGLIWMISALIMMAVETIGSSEEFGWGAVVFAALVTFLLVGGLCGFFIWVGVGALKLRYPKGILRGNAIGALLLGSLGLLSWFDLIGADRPGMAPAPDQALVSEEFKAQDQAVPEASSAEKKKEKSMMDLLISLGWAGSGLLALSGAAAYEAARTAKRSSVETL